MEVVPFYNRIHPQSKASNLVALLPINWCRCFTFSGKLYSLFGQKQIHTLKYVGLIDCKILLSIIYNDMCYILTFYDIFLYFYGEFTFGYVYVLLLPEPFLVLCMSFFRRDHKSYVNVTFIG